MAKKRTIGIRWPMGGLEKRYAYQSQAPYTTPDASNVRPDGSIEGRERGGSRPGLAKVYDEELGSGNPVRLLDQCTVIREDGISYWEDSFKGSSLGSIWTTATWIGTAPGVSSDLASVSSVTGETGVTRDAVSDLDTSAAYQLQMYIQPYQNDHHGKYQFFARMGAGLDPTADGIICELVLEASDGSFSGTVKEYAGSSLVKTLTFTDPGGDSSAEPGWFKLYISANNVTVTWRGQTAVNNQALDAGGPAGSRMGFGINCTQSGGICLVDSFRLQYTKTTAELQERRTHLIASSNGTVYKDDFVGEMSAISTNLSLCGTRSLQSSERGGKLYVADYDTPLKTGTDGAQGTGTTKFDAASVADWSAIGLDTYDYQLEITNVTGGMIAGTYEISSIAAGELTTSPACNSSAGTGYWRLIRAPKIIDPQADTVTQLVASTGILPIGCPLVAIYRDRIVFAGDPDNPHVWYMSRQGTLTDFDYAAAESDTQRAVAATNADAGRIGQPIVALIPGGDDYLIFGCLSQLWVLRGDPAFGGQLDCRSRVIGLADADSWCFTPEGDILFLSNDGIYMLPEGGNGKPISISREKLPEELMNFDRNLHTIQMEWDIRDRGAHIFITPDDQGTSRTHYWFDWDNKGFWPVSIPNDYEPTSMCMFTSDTPGESAVILGGRDGYLRKFSAASETDDGTAINSYCVIGPINMGGNLYNGGRLDQLMAVTAENGGDMDVEVQVGNSHEQAVGASAFSTHQFNTAGLNLTARPMARGMGLCLKVKNGESGRHWALEQLKAVVSQRGPQRVF